MASKIAFLELERITISQVKPLEFRSWKAGTGGETRSLSSLDNLRAASRIFLSVVVSVLAVVDILATNLNGGNPLACLCFKRYSEKPK